MRLRLSWTLLVLLVPLAASGQARPDSAGAPRGNPESPVRPAFAPPDPARHDAEPAISGSAPGRAADAQSLIRANSAVRGRPAHPGFYRSPATGSGVVVSRDGYVLTNRHVVRGCATVAVRVDSSSMTLPARIVAFDPHDDLALLHVPVPLEAEANFRGGPPVRLGEEVIAMGFPLIGLLADEVNLSVGYVAALAGLHNDRHHLQMSAPVQKGSSGGPLFDASGNLVGIVVSKLDARGVGERTGDLPQNVNFAIKAEIARGFLAANGIRPAAAASIDRRNPAEVGEQGRRVTALVECRR